MINRNRGVFSRWNTNVEVRSGRRLVALGFALLVAWLLVMAVAVDASAGDGSVDLAANPELSAAERWSRGTGQSAAMAANPELAAAGRFSGPVSSEALTSGSAAGLQNDSSFMAANPEVMTARRFSRPVSDCGVALGC
jgi:hypothetical protein